MSEKRVENFSSVETVHDFDGVSGQDAVVQITQLAMGAAKVGASNPLATTAVGGSAPVAQGTTTDKSGTITTGGVAQTLAAANSARRFLIVQNNSAGDLWVRFGGAAAATQPSYRLTPGDAWVEGNGSFVNTSLVSIYGATTGQTFSAMEG